MNGVRDGLRWSGTTALALALALAGGCGTGEPMRGDVWSPGLTATVSPVPQVSAATEIQVDSPALALVMDDMRSGMTATCTPGGQAYSEAILAKASETTGNAHVAARAARLPSGMTATAAPGYPSVAEPAAVLTTTVTPRATEASAAPK